MRQPGLRVNQKSLATASRNVTKRRTTGTLRVASARAASVTVRSRSGFSRWESDSVPRMRWRAGVPKREGSRREAKARTPVAGRIRCFLGAWQGKGAVSPHQCQASVTGHCSCSLASSKRQMQARWLSKPCNLGRGLTGGQTCATSLWRPRRQGATTRCTRRGRRGCLRRPCRLRADDTSAWLHCKPT